MDLSSASASTGASVSDFHGSVSSPLSASEPAPSPPAPSSRASIQTQTTSLPPKPPESKRAGKERSEIWPHWVKYDEVTIDEVTKEEVIKKRARCKYCEVVNYAALPSTNGTYNLIKHAKVCPSNPDRVRDSKQKTLSFDSANKSLSAKSFNKDECLRACVEMIVVDELPFSFVEGVGFRKFCSIACPYFQVPSRRTLVRHFLLIYEEKRAKLKEELAHHRVCLTTDTWTSVQNINYMVITAHFIDFDWKFYKRVLNFCVIANHKGNSIGKLLEVCLLDWGLENILTISDDNASSNTTTIEYLKGKMTHWTNAKMVLNGKYMHVRCCAHIVNLIVGDGLKRLENSILGIRNAVKYVRSSPQRLEYFKTCVVKEKIKCKGLVVLDVPTRWNSTYLMLDAALRFQKAFVRMGEDDESAYLSWFGENEPTHEENENGGRPRRRVGPPSHDDWNNATVFVEFLKVFYDMTLKMSVSLKPAVHETFHDLVAIEGEINDLVVNEGILLHDSPRDVLNDMAVSMLKKFGKYWGDLEKVNHFLFIALVLDPRYKLANLFFLLKQICVNEAVALKKKTEVKGILMMLYEEFVGNGTSSQNSGGEGSTDISNTTSEQHVQSRGGKRRRAMADDWLAESEARKTVMLDHEIDRYLLDPIEKVFGEFDILSWWKHNGVKYPGLAKIAKDVLAIPVSTVASESCFSTGGRIVNSFRASLTPKIVEALICCQNWLRSGSIASLESLQHAPTIEEFEFYEAIESELMSTCSTRKTTPAIFQ